MSRVFTKTRVAIGLGTILVIAIGLVAATSGLGDDSVPGDDVAVVDADVNAEAAGIEDGKISKEGFDRSLEQAAKRQGLQQAPTPDSPQYTAVRDQALGDLLDIAWIEGEAQDRGISVSDREVQEKLDQTKNQSFKSEADYQAFLRQSGFTQGDVDLRIKLQLLSQKIQDEVTKAAGEASDDDIENYYEANKSQYAQPESRDVRLIVNKDAAKVNQALTSFRRTIPMRTGRRSQPSSRPTPLQRTRAGCASRSPPGCSPRPSTLRSSTPTSASSSARSPPPAAPTSSR